MENQRAKKWSLRQFCTKSIINLIPRWQTNVGRCKSSDLCLRWVYLSTRHAAFVVNADGNLMLRDLLSTSGTFVNGEVLPICCDNKVLAHGDIVSFGIARYDQATTTHMKICFFEVVADDGIFSMVATYSTPAEDLREKAPNSGQASASKTSNSKDKSGNSARSAGTSKNLAEGSTPGIAKKGKKTSQPEKSSESMSNKEKQELFNSIKVKLDLSKISSNPNSNNGKVTTPKINVRTDLSIKIPSDVILNSGVQSAATSFRESPQSDYEWIDHLVNIIDKDLGNSQTSTSNVAQASEAIVVMMDNGKDFDDISKPSTSEMSQPSEAIIVMMDNGKDFDDIGKPSTSEMAQPEAINVMEDNGNDYDDNKNPSTSEMTQVSGATIVKKENDMDTDDIGIPASSKMAQASEVNTSNKANDMDLDDIGKPSTSKMAQASEAIASNKANDMDTDDIGKPSSSKMAQASQAINTANKANDTDVEDIGKPSTSKMAQASEATIAIKEKNKDFDDIRKPSTSKKRKDSKATIVMKDNDKNFDDIGKPSKILKTNKAPNAMKNNDKDFDEIDKPSTSKMSHAGNKTKKINDDNDEQSSSSDSEYTVISNTDKANSPSSDESTMIWEQQRRSCPSGIRRTILRKIPTKTTNRKIFEMDERERERIKAIRKKKLIELARQKKAEKLVPTLVPTEDAFDALLRAVNEKLANKSDKDSDDD